MLKVAVINDTSTSRHFGCSLVMREINRRLQDKGAEVVWRSFVGRSWRETAPSDPSGISAVIVNGEGTIHHTTRSPRARELLGTAAFAREELNVPVFLINATLHEIAPDDLAAIRKFDAIYVRDAASQEELANAGVPSVVVPDITIAADLHLSDTRRSGVCATDSVVSDDARTLSRVARQRGWSYWPMIYRFRGSIKRWPTLDSSFPGFVRSVVGIADPVLAFSAFAQKHELMVTGRYHAVAFCLATETPFVAVESNTPKISSLVRDVLGDTRRVVPKTALAKLDLSRLISWEPTEIERVRIFCAEARRNADVMFDRITRNG